jgi:hypothetical protein
VIKYQEQGVIMDDILLWKNFSLGKELSLAGSYIYNGLKTFDEMENFYHEEDIFEFLYAISIGTERLEKIVITLKEDIPPDKQNDFEKTLITHNNLELMKRVTKNEDKDVSSLSYEFLQLLSKFYKSWRYDRFSLSDFRDFGKEKKAFIEFMEKNLKIKIDNDSLIVTQNITRYKKFIGRTIGKIIEYLYEIVKRESSRLNIYTYEIRINTKAWKIFIKKEYDFTNEDVFWKELLLYILHDPDNSRVLEVYRSMDPLEFDEADLVDLIHGLKSDLYKQEYSDSLDALYDEVDDKKRRFEFLDMIGTTHFMFPEDEYDEDDEDDNKE